MKYSVQLFILISICMFSFLNAQEYRIAISELDAKGVSNIEAATITDFLRTDLYNTNKFKVLERDKMTEILNEIAFQQTGCTSAECAVEMGQLLNVDKMIVGSLSKLGKTFYISVRFVDVQTGKIEFADRVSCQCPIDILPNSVGDLANKIAKNVYIKNDKNSNIRDLSITEGTGIIYIKSNPIKAKIYIDGILSGITPTTLTNISSGNHTLKLEWETGIEKEDYITILPNEVKKLNYNSDQAVNYNANKITILSNPMEKNVYLDGEFIGQTPFILENINPGNYYLFIYDDEYFTLDNIEIKKNQDQTIRLDLNTEWKTIKTKNIIFSEPFTNVYLNNNFVKQLKNNNYEFDILDFIKAKKNENLMKSKFIFINKDKYYHLSFFDILTSNEKNLRINFKAINLKIEPPNKNFQIFFNSLKVGKGKTVINDLSKFIRGNKLYFFDFNEILFTTENQAYFFIIDIEKNQNINFNKTDYSLVNFSIQPEPFLVKPYKYSRIFGHYSIYFKHGIYSLEIINTNLGVKSKIYKTELEINQNKTYTVEHKFN